jgi:hypothetical protein
MCKLPLLVNNECDFAGNNRQVQAASIEAACEIDRTPSTFNHYFSENITRQRFEKQKRQLRSLKDDKGNIPYATVELDLTQNSCRSIDDFVAEDMLIVLDSYGTSETIYSIFMYMCTQCLCMRATSMMTLLAEKVASKRYGDDTPNILEANFIRKLRLRLRPPYQTMSWKPWLHSPNT